MAALIEQWLAARDAASVRSAWSALAPVRHEVSKPRRDLTKHGAAQLAAAMLGERADWLLDVRGGSVPAFRADRIVDGSSLDHAWDIRDDCHETWELHEQRDGARGVQLIVVGAGTITGRPEGGGVSVVRIFEHDRAVSVQLESRAVATIGEVDLAPLDLMDCVQYFTREAAAIDVEVMRGLLAQVIAEYDAHYDTSTQWPLASHEHVTPHYLDPRLRSTFVDGARSVTVDQLERGPRTWLATAHGLAWGHVVELASNDDGHGDLRVRLPDAEIDRVSARLGAIAKLR